MINSLFIFRTLNNTMSAAGGEDDGSVESGTAVKEKIKLKHPKQYRVLLLNDDYTPMEFVVAILEQFFNKQEDEAVRIMLQVHHSGVGECGIYSFEVAETKVMQVMNMARQNQHPLQCIMEEI